MFVALSAQLDFQQDLFNQPYMDWNGFRRFWVAGLLSALLLSFVSVSLQSTTVAVAKLAMHPSAIDNLAADEPALFGIHHEHRSDATVDGDRLSDSTLGDDCSTIDACCDTVAVDHPPVARLRTSAILWEPASADLLSSEAADVLRPPRTLT